MKNIPFKAPLFVIILFGIFLGSFLGPRIGVIFSILAPLAACIVIWMKVLRASRVSDQPRDKNRMARLAVEAVVTAIMVIGFWVGAFGRMLAEWLLSILT